MRIQDQSEKLYDTLCSEAQRFAPGAQRNLRAPGRSEPPGCPLLPGLAERKPQKPFRTVSRRVCQDRNSKAGINL